MELGVSVEVFSKLVQELHYKSPLGARSYKQGSGNASLSGNFHDCTWFFSHMFSDLFRWRGCTIDRHTHFLTMTTHIRPTSTTLTCHHTSTAISMCPTAEMGMGTMTTWRARDNVSQAHGIFFFFFLLFSYLTNYCYLLLTGRLRTTTTSMAPYSNMERAQTTV